jgi:hypothetical protein
VKTTPGEPLLEGYERPAPYDPEAENGWEEPFAEEFFEQE